MFWTFFKVPDPNKYQVDLNFQFKKFETNGIVVKKKMPKSVVHTQEDISDSESTFVDEDFCSNAAVDVDHDCTQAYQEKSCYSGPIKHWIQ